MEDIQPLVVPTLSKVKISHHLSYPIGAEAVSSALASTAQFPLLKLHFYYWCDHDPRHRNYEFLRVEYLNNATPVAKYPVTELHNRPPQWRWEIVVQPVPRAVRHRIKQYILNSALPEIARWLAERSYLQQQGSDILTFFYDEKAEEFTPRRLAHLEPVVR